MSLQQQQQQQQQHRMMNTGQPAPAAAGPMNMNMMQMPPGAGGAPKVQAATGFYQQQAPALQTQQQQQQPQQGMSMQQQQQHQPMERIDTRIQCPPRFLKLTSTHIPQRSNMVQQSKIPLGGIVRPLANVTSEEDEEVDVVQPTAAGIVRCKQCRTYINAFVTWMDSGRRWRCNICTQVNETPSAYFCHLDMNTGERRDKMERAELCKAVVEYVAPSEYMVRPPQPPSYMFVLDVSAYAARSGMLQAAADGIRKCLDDLQASKTQGKRTQVGFMTFDSGVHYYNLKSSLSSPQMMVVPDLQGLFVPAPDDLLVNLHDSRHVVDHLLDNLGTMFHKAANGAGPGSFVGSALGPALKAAYTVMKHVGGKMLVFQSCLPTLGGAAGALPPGSPRELSIQRVCGTPDEMNVLNSSTAWYRDTGIEFSKAQICVDMFLFPTSYIDAANVSALPKVTGGTLTTYVAFDPAADAKPLQLKLQQVINSTTAFESVMRIRCSKGMRVSNFYGHFYIRGKDLLSLPNCNAQSCFGFDLAHEDATQPMQHQYLTIQSALLYTSANAERRIRVCTQAIPVTAILQEYLSGLRCEPVVALLAKQAVSVGLRSGLEVARNRLQGTCTDVVKCCAAANLVNTSGDDNDMPLPDNLQLLPLYTLSLIKNVCLRGGTDVHPDERVQAMHTVTGMWVDELVAYVHPTLYHLNNCGGDDEGDGSNNNNGVTKVNLSVESLNSTGVFVLQRGHQGEVVLWVGRAVDDGVLQALFGADLDRAGFDAAPVAPSVVGLVGGTDDANVLLQRLRNIIEDGDSHHCKIVTVREGVDEWLESRLYWSLVEDRAGFAGAGMCSYAEFMQLVKGAAVAGHGVGAPGMNMAMGMGAAGPPRYNTMGMGAPPPPGGGAPPVAPGRGFAPPAPYAAAASQPPPPGPPPPGGMHTNMNRGMPPPPAALPGSYGAQPPPPPGSGGYGQPPPPPGSGGYGQPPPPPRY